MRKTSQTISFTRTGAELAVASAHYFVDHYFSTVDADILTYHEVTIDLKTGSE
jgi:hypothetical protein